MLGVETGQVNEGGGDDGISRRRAAAERCMVDLAPSGAGLNTGGYSVLFPPTVITILRDRSCQ